MTAGMIPNIADWKRRNALAADMSFPFCRGRTLITAGRKHCCILSPYRGSFNVSIGLNEACCAGRGSLPGMSPRAEWKLGASYNQRAVSTCNIIWVQNGMNHYCRMVSRIS